MRIAIDISSIPYGTGVSFYTKHLVRALSTLKTTHEFVLFAGAWRQRAEMRDWYADSDLGDNFSLYEFPLPPRAQLQIWNRWQLLPLDWFLGFDVFHSVDWSMPVTNRSCVLTVHDLFFMRSPEIQQHPYAQDLERRLRIAKENRYPVIAVSQTTRQDMLELLEYPEELIEVIYEAGNEKKIVPNKKDLDALKRRLGFKKKYWLMIATQEPRKNLERTLTAFAAADIKDTSLVIVGKAGWGGDLKKSENVLLTGYLPNEELETLLVHAHGLLYPSLYEGFGIPILEAFELGIPVLTSAVASMKEIAKDAAILVDPYSIDALTEGIKIFHSMAEKERNEIIHKATRRAKDFSWKHAAEKTLSVYEKTQAR